MDSSKIKASLVDNFDEEFGTLSGRAYLDHAGATVYSRSQLEAVHRDLSGNLYGNPHTRSPASRTSSDAIDQARFRLLRHFHTDSDQYDVVFTSGATAALALVADAFQFGDGGTFVYLQESHTSVLGMRGRLAGRPVTVTALPAAAADRLLSSDTTGAGDGQRPSSDAAAGARNGQRPSSDAAAAGARNGERPDSDAAAAAGDDTRRGLFAFPAQCNFSGVKYPLRWVSAVQGGALDGPLTGGVVVRGAAPPAGCRWFCLLDAASHAATCDLDLGRVQPDFVCLSFYKMFGYPTGLGALLVHRRAEHTLHKSYFGGGTVQVSLASQDFHVPRETLHQRLEDGTVPFLAMAAVTHGLDTIRRLAGPMSAVSTHVFSLARYTYCHLSAMRHGNGSPVVRIYADTAYDDIATQGGIISFNLLRPDGEFYGATEVEKFAEVYDIDLRTGCFCNPGGCQRHLGLSTDTVKQHFQAGHVCGDETDLIAGRPTGAVRVSFGYMSRLCDADRLLLMVRQCFLSAALDPEQASERLRQAQQRRTASSAAAAVQTEHGLEGGPERPAADEAPGGVLNNAAEDGVRRTAAEAADGDGTPPTPAAAVPALSRPGPDGGAPQISALVLFPVKSCSGQSVPWWPLGPRGLLYDRHWMVVSAGGAALTQKRQPALCRVRPEVSLHTGHLLLTADGFGSVRVPLWTDPALSVTPLTLCESRVCGDRVGGLDCGDEAADWLSHVLDMDGVRLVRQNPASSRTAKLNGGPAGGSLSLSNESPYVLVSRSSVAALQHALQQRGADDGVSEEELTDRFRANLVVSGLPAYLEDSMDSITLGDTHLKVLGGCSRCHMVGVDQTTGERSREPLLTLNATRGRRMPFGVHLGHLAGPPPTNALFTVGQTVSWRLSEGEEDRQQS